MHEQLRSQERAAFIVFQQELPVRLVNICRSGCLLQAPRPVRVGAIVQLRIALDDTEYADDVRIARCEWMQGAVYALGVELLWSPKPNVPRSNAPSLAMRLRVEGDTQLLAARWPNEA